MVARIADGTFVITILGTTSTLHGSATVAHTHIGFASVADLVVANAAGFTVFSTMEGAECTGMWCARTAGAYVLLAGHAFHAVACVALDTEFVSVLRTRLVCRAPVALAYIFLALVSAQMVAIPAGRTLICLVCGALWPTHWSTVRTYALISLACQSGCIFNQTAASITGCTLPRLINCAVLTCCWFAEEAGALRRWGWRCCLSVSAAIGSITSVSWSLITAVRVVPTIGTIIICGLVQVFLDLCVSLLRLQQRGCI
jgi:hypothetical protein